MTSPATVLRRQRGNCFEISTLLVSLLLAAGYDAYVVSGYAGQTTCHGDLSYDDCPLLMTVPPPPPPDVQPPCTKYRARPAKDLRSGYEQMMEARQRADVEKLANDKIAAELAERAASIRVESSRNCRFSL